jgi:hypothetical protein
MQPMVISAYPTLHCQIQSACSHVAHTRKSHASKAANPTAHFILSARLFAAEDFVEDGVDAAAVVDPAAEVDAAAELLLPLASAAPTGRSKPPSTPGGAVLEVVLAAAALYAARVLPPELLERKYSKQDRPSVRSGNKG